MSITSDEINFLIYRYLQESGTSNFEIIEQLLRKFDIGFSHTAFSFAYESQVAKSTVATADIPPGSLISYIQKGLLYVGIEAHVNEDGTENQCDAELTLLNPHFCRVAQGVAINRLGPNSKRKRPEVNTIEENGDPKRVNEPSKTLEKENPINQKIAVSEPISNSIEVTSSDVMVVLGHAAEIFQCSWNPKHNIIATSSGDATARLWAIPNEISQIALEKVQSSSIVLQHKAKILESKSPRANVTVATKTSEVQKDVTTVAWNKAGTALATGSYNGLGRLWSESGELLHTLDQHSGPLFSIKWCNSGESILTGGYDKTAIVWNSGSGAVTQRFYNHSAPILDVDWKDDTTFATCSTDKTIAICKIGEKNPTMTFVDHKDEVNTVKWNASGALLASCSDDHTAKLWCTKSESLKCDLQEHEKEIYTISWSPTGDNTANPNKSVVLASASFDTTVKLWDVSTGKCLSTLLHGSSIYSIEFSPCGDYLASGSSNGVLNVWSTKDASIVKTYSGKGDVFDVSWSKDGDMLAACFSDSSLCVINLRQ